MKKLFTYKNDKYKKTRGGRSRLLNVICAKCGEHLCFYQKDGPGILKRMYLDRIFESENYSGLEKRPFNKIRQFICPKCKEIIGIPYVYKKEDRFAFRLFVGSITKKIIKNPLSISDHNP